METASSYITVPPIEVPNSWSDKNDSSIHDLAFAVLGNQPSCVAGY